MTEKKSELKSFQIYPQAARKYDLSQRKKETWWEKKKYYYI